MSNNQPSVFNFEESHPIRVILQNEEPWFIGNDVCAALCLGNPRSSLALLEEDEKGVHNMDTPSGQQEMTIINEPGLYSLVLRSRKPEAKKFKRWITHEVLPAIRRTGRYAAPVQPELPLPDRAALPAESRSGIVPRMEYNGVAVMPIWEIARATGRTLGGLNTRKHDCNYDLIEGTDVFRGVIITPELRKNAERAGYQLCARASIANFYTATGVDKLLVVKGAPAAVHPEVMPPNKGELPKPELDIPRLTSSRDAITITGAEFRRRFETRDLAVKKLLVKLVEAGYDVQIEQAELAYLLAMLGRCRHMAYEFMARLETMNHQARSLADMSYNTTCQFDRNGRIGMSESALA